jgi:hypothetical protein
LSARTVAERAVALAPALLPYTATFPNAPLRSRTVGFPESGSGLGSPRHFSGRAFPHDAKLQCWRTLRPDAVGFAPPLRHNAGLAELQLSVWLRTHRRRHRVPRAPLPRTGVTRTGAASRAAWRSVTPSSSLVRAHAPDHPPPSAPGSPVARRVFAGCRQPLLRDGPSRRYLCDPCAGARTPTPPRSSAAHVRSFAKDTGLTPE